MCRAMWSLLAGDQGTSQAMEVPGPGSTASLEQGAAWQPWKGAGAITVGQGTLKIMVRFPDMIPWIAVQSVLICVHFLRENSISLCRFSKWYRTHSQERKEEVEKIESNIFAKADETESLFLPVSLFCFIMYFTLTSPLWFEAIKILHPLSPASLKICPNFISFTATTPQKHESRI